MAGEIIFVHVGGCGLNLGVALWAQIAYEAGVNAAGDIDDGADGRSEGIEVLFAEQDGQLRPRAIFADLDPEAVAGVQYHPALARVPDASFVAGEGGTSGRFDEGYAGAGRGLLDKIASAVRREVDGCRSLQGFVVVHGAGGGTGGGLGTLVIEHLRAEYPRAILATFTVLPSSQSASALAAAVCQARTVCALGATADLCILLGNDAANVLLFRAEKLEDPQHADRNQVFALALASVAAAWRSPAGMSLRKMAVSLCPVPGANFQVLSHFPATANHRLHLALSEYVAYAFSHYHVLVSLDPRHGKLLSSVCILRGELTEVEGEAQALAASARAARVDWIWDPAKVRVLIDNSLDSGWSATLIATNTAMKEVLRLVASALMVARYAREGRTGDGPDEAALEEVAAALEDLIAQHERLQELGGGVVEATDENEWGEFGAEDDDE